MNKKAFGLLETVIAMMIVTMTVLAVYDSVAQSRMVVQNAAERSGGISFVSIFANNQMLVSSRDNIDLRAHIISRYGISDMTLLPAKFDVNASLIDTKEESDIVVGRNIAGKTQKYISIADGRRTEWYKIVPGR